MIRDAEEPKTCIKTLQKTNNKISLKKDFGMKSMILSGCWCSFSSLNY